MALWAAALACVNDGDGTGSGEVRLKGDEMATDLREAVLAKDWGATLLAREAGPASARGIADLTAHEDRDVRLLAVTCLGDVGGPEAGSALLKALRDSDLQVRETAVRGLMAHPDPNLWAGLLDAFDASLDPHVRGQIPMIMAAGGGAKPDLAPLEERWKKETDDGVREGLVVGLARLGHEDARADFVKRLHASAGDRRDAMLRHCDFIGQEWLLRPLKPVLPDVTKLRYIGPHGFDVNLRACDIAVNLVARISGRKFSFGVDGRTNYTPQQIDEVRKYLDTLPR